MQSRCINVNIAKPVSPAHYIYDVRGAAARCFVCSLVTCNVNSELIRQIPPPSTLLLISILFHNVVLAFIAVLLSRPHALCFTQSVRCGLFLLSYQGSHNTFHQVLGGCALTTDNYSSCVSRYKLHRSIRLYAKV